MEPVSEKDLAEFKKCITYVCTEPDDEKVLAGLRYILSLPDRSGKNAEARERDTEEAG